MKRFLFILISISIFLTGCYHFFSFIDPPYYDGPYSGKIIDVATGEPIEGVVILGVRYNIYPHAAGHTSEFYDAIETVTGQNGEFTIPGGRILIFKAGYTDYQITDWNHFKKTAYKVEDDKVVIRLKKLTMELRRDPSYPPTEAPKEKIKLMVNEINRDRIERGLGTIEIGR